MRRSTVAFARRAFATEKDDVVVIGGGETRRRKMPKQPLIRAL